MGVISEREAEIVEEFSMFDEWLDKYQHIIEMGQKLTGIDEAFRTDAYKVKGCQSQVWLHPEVREGLVHFDADSDAAITRGLIAMMVAVLSDRPAAEIAKSSLGFLDRLGLKEHLSPTRSNGLSAMVKQMKLYALVLAQRG